MSSLPPTPVPVSPVPGRAPEKRTTFWQDFRTFFARGLLVILPSILTLWILYQAYLFVDTQIAEPINRGIRALVLHIAPQAVPESRLPSWFQINAEKLAEFREILREQATLKSRAMLKWSDADLGEELRALQFKMYWDSHWYFRLLGLAVAVTLIYLAGVLLRGYLGRQAYYQVELLIGRIPIIKAVYPHMKRLVEMVLGERPMAFKRVVLVEYPRKDIWAIAFVTSGGLKSARDKAGEPVMTVFVPSTPTLVTGVTVTVRVTDTLDVPISVDEAARFILTGGVLVPGRQTITPTATIDASVVGGGGTGTDRIPALDPVPPDPSGRPANQPAAVSTGEAGPS